MKKDIYYIGCSGEDSIFIERELTKNQAEFVKSIIDELQTTREGCWMEKLPSNKEIKVILERYNEWKQRPEIPEIIEFNKFYDEYQLFNRFMYDILHKEDKIGWEVQGYIINEIGKIIDLYKKL